jgi:hypothetical protein
MCKLHFLLTLSRVASRSSLDRLHWSLFQLHDKLIFMGYVSTSLWITAKCEILIILFRIVFWDVLPCKQFWTSYSPPWELEISHIDNPLLDFDGVYSWKRLSAYPPTGLHDATSQKTKIRVCGENHKPHTVQRVLWVCHCWTVQGSWPIFSIFSPIYEVLVCFCTHSFTSINLVRLRTLIRTFNCPLDL